MNNQTVSRTRGLVWLLILLAIVLRSSVTLAQAPSISSISPSTGVVGMQVQIAGSGFGAAQGSSSVALNGTNAQVTSWSDSSIAVIVPTGATSGPFSVTVGGSPAYSSTFTVTALPSGWLDVDIGAVGKTGSAGYANGVFTVSGAGAGISGVADAFHFVYQSLSGDGAIVARVVSAPVGSLATVMVRETLSAGATDGQTTIHYASSTYFYTDFDQRTTTGGSTTESSYITGTPLPYWIKLVRSGSTFSSYASPDGVNWTQLGASKTISMAQNVYVGLGLSSGSTTSLATANFDNVSISSTAAPGPVINSVSATTGSVGSQVAISGSGFGTSQGSSVVTLNAAPVTINAWSDSAISITIPASATTGLLVVSVAPSMNDSNPVWFTVTSQPLPTGWLDGDIGAVGKTGSAGYANGVFTVSGAGAGISGVADAFHFVYQSLSGDGAIVARVVSAPVGSLATVMVRETLSAGATDGQTTIHYASSTYFYTDFDQRTTTGGSTTESSYITGTPLPYWIKLVRSGSTFSSYASPDGVNWTQLGASKTISMAQNVYVGLGLSSGSTTSLATANFDNVSISSTAAPGPVINSVSATTGSVGSQVAISGSGFGTSQGSSVVTLNAAPVTINAWSDSAISITIPASATTGLLVVSVAPSMNDSNPVWFTVTSQPLPTGWLDGDIGAVGKTGSAGYANGVFTVSGAGLGLSGAADAFHFVYQPMSGDGSIVARVVSAPVGSFAGAMVRETLGTGSTDAVTMSYPTSSTAGYMQFYVRTTTGANLTNPGFLSGPIPPYWVKVTRSGSTFTSYASSNGTSWTQMGSAQTISMAQNVYVGLMMTSRSASSLATATFDNVSTTFAPQILAPSITSLAPSTAVPGTPISIAGANFGSSQGSSTVTFNGTAATPTSWSATSISVPVPLSATSGNVVVTVNGASSNAAAFTVSPTPTINSLSPTSGTVAMPITINGVNFGSTQGTSTLTFNGTAATPTSWSFTRIVAPVPTGASTGNVVVTVNGTASAGAPFTVLPIPSITSLSTASATIGAAVTITGTNFGSSSGTSTVTFNGVAASSSSWNPTTIVAVVPFGATTGNVVVTVSGVASNPVPISINLLTLPPVAQVLPANGSTGFPENGRVVVRFAQPVTQAAIIPGTLTLSQGATNVSGSLTSSNDGLSVTFTPSLNLAANTNYSVAVADLAGNQATPEFQSTFTTLSTTDTVAPTIVETSPPNSTTGVPINAPIVVQFSKAMDPGTLTAQSFTVTDLVTGRNLAGMIQVDATGTSASFVPQLYLPVGRNFAVQLSSTIQDQSGNGLTGNNTRVDFSTSFTADTDAPQVLGMSPQDRATGIPVNALIVLEFSEPLNVITVSKGFQVQANGQAVSGAVALSGSNQLLTFTPTGGLSANTTYTVVTSSQITDVGGVALANPETFSFSTGSAQDASTPSVINVSPSNNSSSVPVNAIAQLQFSKAMDPFTITTSTFQVIVPGGVPMPGSISLSSDGQSATFTSSVPLNTFTRYSVVANGIADIEGHVMPYFSSFFTTGAATTGSAPTVQQVSPPASASGVPVNVRVDVMTSVPLDPATVTNSSIVLSVGGISVPGTVSLGSSGTTLTYLPATLLSASTTYTISVSGVTDQAGNLLAPYSSTFTTGSSGGGNSNTPSVVGVSPANGATAVPLGSAITLTFNEAVDPTTVNNTTVPVQVSNLNATLAGTYSVDATGTIMTFVPLSPMPPSTTISVRVNTQGILDLSGNAGTSYYSTFTTAAGTDSTAPTFTITPANGATGVNVNTPIVLTFSESMNPNTLNSNNIAVQWNGTVQSAGITRSADNRVVTINSGTLPVSSTVSVLVTRGVADLAGNGVADFQEQFQTAPASSSNAPNIAAQRPGAGATGVPLSTSVVLYFSQPMNSATLNGAVHLSQNGVVVAGTIQVTDNGQVLQFSPSAPLEPGALVQVFVDSTAQSLTGRSVNNYQSSFTTAPDFSITAPAMISSNPVNGATGVPTNVVINFAFKVPIQVSTLTADAVLCYQNGSWVQTAVNLVGNTLIQIVPRYSFQANSSVTCKVSTSLQGTNGLASPGATINFTTGTAPDSLIPALVSLSPPNGSSSVGDNASVRLVFNKPINPLTVSGNTVQLSGGGITLVPDSISFSNNNQIVVVVPHAPLPDNTQMTLTISGITDAAGHPVATQTTQFTTGIGPDLIAPLLVWMSPSQTNSGVTNVPLNAIVQLQVNEAVDPWSVDSNSLFLVQGGQHVSGTYSISSDGQTITFIPSSPLSPNQQYSVFWAAMGIKDLAGNQLSSSVSLIATEAIFTTGTTSTTSAPHVAGINPSDTWTGIPTNSRVVIAFDEPVDAAKLAGITLTGPSGLVLASQALTNGNQTVTLVPVAPLTVGSQYTINIAGVADLSGNVLASPVSSSFSTGTAADLTSPAVLSTTPANYATGISTSTDIQVQFSKAIDPLTVTASTFELFPFSTIIPVPAVISLSPDNRIVTLTPSQPLDPGTSYVISVTSGITDTEGHTLQGTNYYFNTSQGTPALPPVIATMSPSSARVGTSVTINGTYFGTSQGSSTVTFNGVPATVTSWSDVQILATVPSGATTGPLVMTVNGTNSNSPRFTVTATPVITSVSPASATIGTVLTITGSNFGNALDSVVVNFPQNINPAPDLTPITRTPTSITVAVPTTSAASGNIRVVVDNVWSDISPFTLIPTPKISSLSTYAGVPGTTVNVVGSNFGNTQSGSTINFNGVAATVTSWGTTQIIAIAPSNVTTGPVTVVANSVSSNTDLIFTVTTPAIGNLSPPASAVGARVTLVGSGLAAQGLTTQVSFNGIPATVLSATSSSVSVAVPSNATSGPVTASVGGFTSNGVAFTVEQPPTVTAISPSQAAEGSVVTITGTGFGATQSNSTVTFWTGNSAQINSWSDTSIQAVVPTGASSGPTTITVGSVNAQGPWVYITSQLQVTDSLGHQTTYQSMITGGQWVLTSSEGPGCSSCSVRGNVTNTADAYGNTLSTTDDLGHITTYTYDLSSNITSVSKPLDANSTSRTSYTYNGFGEVLTMTDPLGNVTTNTYDAKGNLTSVSAPAPNGNTAASVTQFAYDTKGELTQITDPLNHLTTLAYYPTGLIQSITDAQNNTTSYAYDTRGNRTSVIEPLNGNAHPTTFVYNIMNRLTGITYPDASSVSFAYDSRGRRISSTDQNNRATTYTYDDADRLIAVTDAANNTTQYGYDAENNLTSVTDANGHITSFAYNARGWLTQTTFPSTLVETYGYDLVGNLTSKTDRKNQTIQYVYDALYRLTQKTYPDSTSVEYTYDLAAKVQQVNDPTGTYGFAYDNMGRLIGTTTTYSFLPGHNFQNTYTYDASSNRMSLTAPDNSITTYGYDTLNRLNGMANSWAGSFGFGYDALSRRTSLTRPNGVNTSYGYDAVSHLLSVLHQAGANTLDGATYTYDLAGNRTSKTNYLNGVTSNYGYDPLYELTQVTQGGSTTESYSYDAVGNRLSSFGVPNYNYNSSNELTSNSAGSYTSDANGSTLSDPSGKQYTWDFENRLTQVVVPGTNGGTTTFKYDPFGRRIQKSGPLGTTNYLYEGVNLLEEVDNAGNALARYAQGGGTDQPLAEFRSETTSYYQQDALSSVTSLSNSAGALANTYSYDSVGKLTASTGTIINPVQYTGREFDAETGIYEYRARYLDQSVGRFISEDPLRFNSGVNFYPYVDNNPAGKIDPLGLLPKGKDKWWGYNDKNFQRWWHRCYWKGEPYDGNREEVAAAYEYWVSLGKPDDCGGKKQPCEQPQEQPVPDTPPVPKPDPNKVLTWGLILGTGAAIAEEYGWIVLVF